MGAGWQRAVAAAKATQDITAPRPWVKRKPPATAPAKIRKRQPAASSGPPEWVLQAAMAAEFNKCKDEGLKFRFAGDMNSAKRTRWAAAQAKAMGLNPGETDLRLYAYPARLLLVEVKTVKGKKSDDQDKAHDEFAELGFTVLVVTPRDEEHARSIAREIATKFCDSPQGWGGL